MNKSQETKGRIRSIDALRAMALFGILMVHTLAAFGFHSVETTTLLGSYLSKAISSLLVNRCATVFGILFGVSFYLILRNPNYSSSKFVWRCFILIGIGVIVKVFYTYDALIWYGIWGMFLVCFRKLSTKQLWVSLLLLYVLDLVLFYYANLTTLCFGSYISPYKRYDAGNTLIDVVSYPIGNAILDHIRGLIGDPLGTLCKFLLGYCFARSGIIENIRSYAKIKWLIVFLALYLGLWGIALLTGILWINGLSKWCGSICYAIAFLWLYYQKSNLFSFLEPYGKLGLTNYAFQSIVGVILCATFFVPYHLPFEWLLLTMVVFYAIQVLFSIMWLKRFRYGPLEYLWRCATERRIIGNKKLDC